MKSIVSILLVIMIFGIGAFPVLADPSIDSDFSCTTVTEIPQIECEALVALYNSTDGDGWVNRSYWFLNDMPSTWHGIYVSSGHVIDISLGYNNLSGSIPPQIGDFVYLESINLSGNKLVGGLPVELWTLSSLLALVLSNNQLTGYLPAEIGSLTNLFILDLEFNQFNGLIPSQIGNLLGLQLLFLSFNQFTGNIPPDIGNATGLQSLYLNENQLTGSIPDEIGNLTQLTGLLLGKNQLTGNIPASIGDLANLQTLYLDSNQLSGSIPFEISFLTNLSTLDLSNNHLIGDIPAVIANIPNLLILRLSNNQLIGDIPGSFVNLTSLSDPGAAWDGGDGLDLDYNHLNVPPGYPIPGDPLHEFLVQKDPYWQYFQGFSQVIGSLGGQLTSLDSKTDILIPAGALITDTTFTFIPLPTPRHAFSWMQFANNSFDLSAEDSLGNPVTTFNLPITVTLTYTDTDIIGIPENLLGLYYWDGTASAWIDAVTTCPGGAYTRDLDANQLSLPLCHLTEFGLFGNPLHIFMPVIRR